MGTSSRSMASCEAPWCQNERIAEMMQADLAKIGVTAKLVTYEWGEYRKRAGQAST
jgi:ABC-type transport system substrate-binding protein